MNEAQDGITEDWTSALVAGPTGSPHVDERCNALLGTDGARDAHVLLVAYAESPDRRLARLSSHAGEQPRHLEIVGVGDSPRSATGVSCGKIQSPRGDVTVSYAQPADLTGLGIRISDRLAECHHDSPDGSSQLLVCFDSLSALLQHVDLERAFRFVHVLTGRLRAEGARAHFHLDPAAHDDRTVAVLTTLFDVVVDPTEE